MAAELKGRVVGGEGEIAEIDIGCFGGHAKPANVAERKDRRFAMNYRRRDLRAGRQLAL